MSSDDAKDTRNEETDSSDNEAHSMLKDPDTVMKEVVEEQTLTLFISSVAEQSNQNNDCY